MRVGLKRIFFLGGHQILSPVSISDTTFIFLVDFSSKFRRHVATASHFCIQLLGAEPGAGCTAHAHWHAEGAAAVARRGSRNGDDVVRWKDGGGEVTSRGCRKWP